MRIIAVALLSLLAGCSVVSQTPPIEPGVSHDLAKWRAANYSNIRYNLNLTLEKMSPVLKGTIEIKLQYAAVACADPACPPRAIILDWRRIAGHRDKTFLGKVSLNGKPAESSSIYDPTGEDYDPDARNLLTTDNTFKYEWRNEHLIFRNGVQMGENVITIEFTSPILTSGSAITRYVDKEDGAEYIYSLFVPSDASTAFPVFDQPDLKAKFTLSVSSPSSWDVVTNSSLIDAKKTMIRKRFLANDVVGPLSNPTVFEGPYLSEFSETKPISTYVFAFAAGPWERVSVPRAVATGVVPSPQAQAPVATAQGTDMGADLSSSIYVRRSQAAKFQPHAAEVFRLNREGIKYLEGYFDYKFPFPKYDIVLIPEFPFGGMEHAGTTFLRESSVIFPSEPTKGDHITRANLIFHEAAHQWFGDAVTMRWFDDLWLKEGFAEFMAYKTLEKVMPDANAWKVFYERNKQAAYATDSTKGTTPIYQKIDNLSAAKSAYGNIVYRKAPSFLRQAEFYIGEQKFQTAVRVFLRKHEFANAGWEDLVGEFQNVQVAAIKSADSYAGLSDRDKSEMEGFTRWQIDKEFAEFWVTKPGMAMYRISPSIFEGDRLNIGGGATGGHTSLMTNFSQKAILENVNWTQNISVLKVYSNGEREQAIAEIGNRKWATLPDRDGKPPTSDEYKLQVKTPIDRSDRTPLFVFPNYKDYGYGIFLLADKSREYVLKNVQNEKDAFLRSMMYGALWDSVREAELDPRIYVELVIKNLATEQDETIAASLLGRVSTAMNDYLSEPEAVATGELTNAKKKAPVATAPGTDLKARFEEVLLDRLQKAPTAGQRVTFYRAFVQNASTAKGRVVLKEMLRQGTKTMTIRTKDRFDIVTRLIARGDPDGEKLLAELEKTETSEDAKRYAYAARAAVPSAAVKAKYFTDFVSDKEISESWIESAIVPFNNIRHADLTQQYLEQALKELPNLKRTRKIFFVNNWLAAFIGGQRDEKALAIVNKFLTDNPTLDNDLRLKVLENVDIIERAVKIRQKYKAN